MEMTCTICDDKPVFTDKEKLQFHLEVAHCIHFYKCDDSVGGGLEDAINRILRPN